MKTMTIEALFDKVRSLQDRLDIMQLVSSYGPSFDSMQFSTCANLWAEDGKFHVSGIGAFSGRDAVEKSFAAPDNIQQVEDHGLCHFLSAPYILIQGDQAAVTNYGLTLMREGKRNFVHRTIAIRWQLRRTSEGWKVEQRVNQLFDGNETARKVIGAYAQIEWPL